MRKAESQVTLRTHIIRVYSTLDTPYYLLLNTGIEGMFSIPTPVYQIAWQGPRASQTLRFSIVGDTYRLDPSTAGHVYTSATYMHAHYCCSSHFYANRCGCRCNVRWGMCSIELKLFRSALGMGKIQGVSLYIRQF